MTRLIGLKELQLNTKKIRQEVEKGVRFIVVYRSKPAFEIRKIEEDFNFVDDLKVANLYNDGFIRRMEKAESDIKAGRVKTFANTAAFLKSLD